MKKGRQLWEQERYRAQQAEPRVWWRKYHGRRQRLAAGDYAEIRRLHATGQYSLFQLGQRFGVSGAHVSKIVNQHVDE